MFALVNAQICVIVLVEMTRWLPRDLLTMPLGEIEDEISQLERLPSHKRSVRDVERMADLREARRRIKQPSCSKLFPSLQNIPIRTDLGRQIRRSFAAREPKLTWDADFGQIERRIVKMTKR